MEPSTHNRKGMGTPFRRAGAPLFYRFEAQLKVVPIGIVPEGMRMANAFEGLVTEGEFLGARVWGIDHLLLRSDGVCVIDAQKTISQGEQLHIYEHVRGYCLPPSGMHIPPLTVLLEPGFEWPNVDFPIVAFSTFRAGAPPYAFLNDAMARIDGWANFSTGGLAVETRLVAHDAEVPPPRRPAGT